MRTKKEVYKKEQDEIVDTIINIVFPNPSQKKEITLYELDHDLEKQNKIIKLIPIIRKYYSFNNLKAVGEPEKIKRPWLSIIKQLTKSKYKINKTEFRYKNDGKVFRTMSYKFNIIIF